MLILHHRFQRCRLPSRLVHERANNAGVRKLRVLGGQQSELTTETVRNSPGSADSRRHRLRVASAASLSTDPNRAVSDGGFRACLVRDDVEVLRFDSRH
jgi:hypothetical protein